MLTINFRTMILCARSACDVLYALLSLPDKKTTTAVVKCDKTRGLDRNDRQKWSRLQSTLIRKGSIKYCLLLLWVHLKISCISRLCRVWNNVCVHVCKTRNWWFIIICNCLYIVVINCGWRMDRTVLSMVTEGCDGVILCLFKHSDVGSKLRLC